ncbi:hypothetical protein F751_6038 [Auxenochlorella protothecoides]|uniref:TF-B3 domain-containing protein n=1 Tax=Auxenochlorella protothecoides TaxID=3075 RepID=A0A087SI26_AUXPR|nr:hypothetical protein F751_6038 [Auxenochlorella protothecoides]KFM25380.1 hypothetical protein F751_6038 [Auxenochlorella protothecoides]
MSPHFASSKSQQTRVKEPPAWKDEVPAKLHLTLAPSLASSEGTPGSQEGALGHCLETPDESSAGQGGSLERHSPPPQVSAFASAAVQSGVRGTDRPPAAPARAATASPLGSLSEADALRLSVLLAHARLQIQKEAQQGLASRSPSSGSEASPAADIHPLLMQGLTALPCHRCPPPLSQYEGFMSSGQRHFRLTSGWSGLMRVQNVTIGDTLALERWTEDRTVIHLRIIRRQGREGEALPGPPA